MRKSAISRSFLNRLEIRKIIPHGPHSAAVFVLLIAHCMAFGRDPELEKNVLILNGLSNRLFDTIKLTETEIRARVPYKVNFSVQYLETRRFDNNEGLESDVVDTLKRTYDKQNLDLVMAQYYPALEFAVKYRDRLFPGVPIVFWGVAENRLIGQKIWPGVSGVTNKTDVQATIDLALFLHPHTNTAAIVSGNSQFDRYWLTQVQIGLSRYQDRVKQVDLVGLSMDQLMERLTALPPQTVIFFQEGPWDSIHQAIGTYDRLAWIGQRFPTYCIWPEACLDHGGIGGVSRDLNKQAVHAAEVAARVLSGELPDDIPVMKDRSQAVRVDWRALRRWNIPESALPPGSVVLFRELTLWERYRKYVVGAVVVIVVQLLLILGLLWQRARKRKAEAVLRESEQRFSLVANSAPVMIRMSGRDKLCTYFNQQWIDFTGRSMAAELGKGWAERVHPDDLEGCLETYTKAFDRREPFRMEYRLRRYDGEYRWIFDIGVPRFNADGSFAGYIGSCLDVTDRKVAEEALAGVSRRLIEAHEEERTRIARELHDDINQRIALLAINLERLKQEFSATAVNGGRINEVCQQVSDLGSDIQSLSHRLHSSKLEYLGLAAAAAGFCKEVSDRQGVEIEFHSADIPKKLPQEISLCLFRVLQEALQNAIKHSGRRQFQVRLRGESHDIHLAVSDSGVGFDPNAAFQGHGLGLISMKERLNLVGGELSLNSQLQHGTTVHARVPLRSAARSLQAAG